MALPTKNNVYGFPLGGTVTVGDLDVLGNLHVFGTSQLDGNVTLGADLNINGTNITINGDGNLQIDNIVVLSPAQRTNSYKVLEVATAAIPLGKQPIVVTNEFGLLGTVVGNQWTAPYDAIYSISFTLFNFTVTVTGIPYSSVNIAFTDGLLTYGAQVKGDTATDPAFPEMYGATCTWTGPLTAGTNVNFYYGIFEFPLAGLAATGALRASITLC